MVPIQASHVCEASWRPQITCRVPISRDVRQEKTRERKGLREGRRTPKSSQFWIYPSVKSTAVMLVPDAALGGAVTLYTLARESGRVAMAVTVMSSEWSETMVSFSEVGFG